MLGDAIVSATIPAVDFKRARNFYEQKLGFKAVAEDPSPGVMYRSGRNSLFYLYYQKNFAKCDHTALSFLVDNIEAEVNDLRKMGIKFEEYNIPEMEIKTANSVASFSGMKVAWFKDTESNIIAIAELSKSAMAKLEKRKAGAAA